MRKFKTVGKIMLSIVGLYGAYIAGFLTVLKWIKIFKPYATLDLTAPIIKPTNNSITDNIAKITNNKLNELMLDL